MGRIWQRLVTAVIGWLAPGAIVAQEWPYEWRGEMHPMWWTLSVRPISLPTMAMASPCTPGTSCRLKYDGCSEV